MFNFKQIVSPKTILNNNNNNNNNNLNIEQIMFKSSITNQKSVFYRE
jgi:hypothetical protein